jgi:hypothetical protein
MYPRKCLGFKEKKKDFGGESGEKAHDLEEKGN